MTKICTQCGRELSDDHFYRWKYGADGLRRQCKDCCKSSNNQYYAANSESVKAKVKEYATANRDRLREYYKEYRLENLERIKDNRKEQYVMHRDKLDSYKTPCAKCGETRLYLMDFHHVNPMNKSFTIIDKFRSTDDVLTCEIQKCICLCANCHREFHHIYGLRPENPEAALTEYIGKKQYKLYTGKKTSKRKTKDSE